MTWRTVARRRWPRAGWIAGDGPIATVSDCPPCRTVELHRTRDLAEATLAFINHYACGHGCIGRHRVVCLAEGAAVA